MKRRSMVVVAVGGNALAPAAENVTVYDQFRHTRESLGSIIELARRDWGIVVVHGNGPQVGDELLRNELAASTLPEQPLGVLVAATAGWIGYMIQQTLQNGLSRAGIDRAVVAQVTQVLIDPRAPESVEPSKYIGRILGPEQADRLRASGWTVKLDRNGALRRVVPSPVPLEIIETETILELAREGVIVVAAGGGGVPVYRDAELGLEGFDGVIDKDHAAALLGREIGAETLLILTDVAAVYRGFGTEEQTAIGRLRRSEAEALLETDELGGGTMRPKIRAAVDFLRAGGHRVLVARLDQGREALDGLAGTEIVN